MHYYIHILPGQIRVHSSDLKKNKTRAFSVRNCLKTLGGIQSVKMNLATGSVLIQYDRNGVNSKTILNQLAEKGFRPL